MEKYPCVAKSAASEESGWTSYFEEFSNTNSNSNSNYNREGNSSCFTLIPSSSSSSSLVSDAASACKFSHTKLTFKKTRTTNKQIISSHQDDPLEDTASSPLNSPKVGELHPTEMTSRKIIDDQLDASSSPMDKALINYSESEILDDDEDKNVKGESERNRIECTELKKRGLCLVPLSMLVNYFG